MPMLRSGTDILLFFFNETDVPFVLLKESENEMIDKRKCEHVCSRSNQHLEVRRAVAKTARNIKVTRKGLRKKSN